jgi:SNF2 family DNA or RNA helicase
MNMVSDKHLGVWPNKALMPYFENEAKLLDPVEAERLAEEKVADGLWPKLKRFQQECVIKAIMRGGRLLIADEMGLGKTVEAVAVAR